MESLTLKKILLATDGSSNSRRAAHLAYDLARKFNSKVLIVYVLYIPSMYKNDLEFTLQSFEEEGKKILLDTKKIFENKNVIANTKLIKDKKPSAAIVGLAKEDNLDLIVMGRCGEHNAHLLGSVSDRVIREATCSVLLAR